MLGEREVGQEKGEANQGEKGKTEVLGSRKEKNRRVEAALPWLSHSHFMMCLHCIFFLVLLN